MRAVVSKLGAWAWYLLPANPILVRVVHGMSRRPRHLWLRFAYLGILALVVVTALMSYGSASGSLSSLAKGASRTFMLGSIVQLALISFLAPVFTAGAITQERDAQTYNILITTPLSNAQIVIGSLISRLYFVIVLLLAGLPVFFMTMIYGGVTTNQITRSFLIALGTAFLTGSLAILVSMVRVGTRKTIFSFYLTIAIYLFTVYAAGVWLQSTWIPESAFSTVTERKMSWLAAFHPFLALDVALNRQAAPDLATAANYGTLGRYYIAYPYLAYTVQTFVLSAILIGVSVFFVRRVTREGEVNWYGRIWERIRPGKGRTANGERTRKAHNVWANPVAWREAVTRASAMSKGIGRYAIIGGGLLAALVMVYYYETDASFTLPKVRTALMGMVAIEFALVLLIGTNTAASALTKEKESHSLDILLTTPLTSDYIIRGKIRGLVSFALPLIAVPVLSLLIFAVWDLMNRREPAVAFVDIALELGVIMVVFSAYASLLGLQFSLKQKKTVRAVIMAVGALVLVNLLAFLFWQEIVDPAGTMGGGLAPATPFTAIRFMVDPNALLADKTSMLQTNLPAFRMSAFIGTLIFVSIHGLIVFSWYRSMVRSFDMVIRKQSAN